MGYSVESVNGMVQAKWMLMKSTVQVKIAD